MSRVSRVGVALDRRGGWVVVGAMILFALLYGAACWIKLRNFLYADIDLAIFVEAMEGMLRGSLHSSIRGMPWIADHSSFVLFLLLPAYALFRHAFTLLALQIAALALGAWPVWRMARREIGGGVVPVALALSWLAQPALGYVALFEFHPEVFSVPALLFAFDAMLAGRRRAFLLWCALALLGKEDAALAVLGLAAYAALRAPSPRPRGAAAGAAVLAVASLVLTFAVIHPAFGSQAAAYGDMYREWGPSLGDVLANALRHPFRFVLSLVSTPGNPADTTAKLELILHLLGPWLFLPLASLPALAIAAPLWALHALSWRTPQHAIAFQYAALMMPFVASAAVLGVRNARAWARARRGDPAGEQWATRLAASMLVATALAQLAFGPFGLGLAQTVRPTEAVFPGPYDRLMNSHRERFVASLPDRGAIVAGFEFLAHVARRDSVTSLHHILRGRYTFSAQPFPIPRGVVSMIADMSTPAIVNYDAPEVGTRLRDVIDANRLRPVASAGDLVLFARDAPDPVDLVTPGAPAPAVPAVVRFGNAVDFLGYDPPPARVASGALAEVGTCWRRVAVLDLPVALTFRLVDGDGTPVFEHTRMLGYLAYPAADWPVGMVVSERYRLPIPEHVSRGTYSISAELRLAPPALRSDPERGLELASGRLIQVLQLGSLEVVEPAGH